MASRDGKRNIHENQPSSSWLLAGAGWVAVEFSWDGSWIRPLLPNGFNFENTDGEEDCAGWGSGVLRDHARLFMESRNEAEAMVARYCW